MAERDIRSLDIAMLRAFEALMRERSVSRAAARLFLSQPAVSASLRRLRETFGDPLFTRTAHGVLPTERALALAAPVERVLADLAQMIEPPLRFDEAASSRIFRVAGSDHASRLMLPPLATLLAARGSGLRVFWETGAIATLTQRLRKGDVDLAVLPRPQAPRDVASTLLYEDRYALAARCGHPQIAGAVSLDLFCSLPHVALGDGASALDDVIDEALHHEGRTRLVQLSVTTFSQVVDVLAGTEHVAVLPLRVAGAHADRLEVHALPIALPSYQLFVCWNRRADSDLGVQWLRAQCVAAVGAAISASRTSSAAPASPSAAAVIAAPPAPARAPRRRPAAAR